MQDYKRDMGHRIKYQRKLLKFTQEEMAEQLGISVKHFSEVERGLTGLSIENLVKLSRILGMSLDYMIKGEGENEKWESSVEFLEQVPEDKIKLIKELIKIGVDLTKHEV